MKRFLVVLAVVTLASCHSGNPYDIGYYFTAPDQDKILTGIVTYVFDAPPYTKMSDRFKPEHRGYYSSINNRFHIERYFVAEDGTHYFYLLRPAPKQGENRGVGGHFRLDEDFNISEFREEFVTPILPEAEVKGRCAFLFDEMIQGNLEKYLAMESYVQWPNPISYYDTITYEWKMKPEYTTPD